MSEGAVPGTQGRPVLAGMTRAELATEDTTEAAY